MAYLHEDNQVRSASPKEIDDYIQIQMEIAQAEHKI